jgi:hypothetical protein
LFRSESACFRQFRTCSFLHWKTCRRAGCSIHTGAEQLLENARSVFRRFLPFTSTDALNSPASGTSHHAARILRFSVGGSFVISRLPVQVGSPAPNQTVIRKLVAECLRSWKRRTDRSARAGACESIVVVEDPPRRRSLTTESWVWSAPTTPVTRVAVNRQLACKPPP